MGTLMHDFDRRKVVSLTATEQVAVSVFHSVSPVTNGAMSAYALRIGKRLVCHPASPSSGLWLVTGGVVFSKLSKLLNQGGALSAPYVRIFCSRRSLAERRDAAERLDPSLLMSDLC
jgi:hypothetical protein